jgi:hypothetical protein
VSAIFENGFEDRFPAYKQHVETSSWKTEYNVDPECAAKFGGDQYCLISNPNLPPTDLLIGDSHTNHFFNGLSSHLTKQNRNLLLIGASGCLPLIDVDMAYHYAHGVKIKCYDRLNDEYTTQLSKSPVEHVYLAFAHEMLLDPMVELIDIRNEINFQSNKICSVEDACIRTIELAQRNGKSVSLIVDLTDTTYSAFIKCLAKHNSEKMYFGMGIETH